MPKKLQPVSKGPKGLVKVLNALIEDMNGIELTPGSGIHITPTGSGGWIISTSGSGTDEGTSTSGSPSGQQSPTSPTMGGQWLTVTIVDPDTCETSEVQVWARPVPSQ